MKVLYLLNHAGKAGFDKYGCIVIAVDSGIGVVMPVLLNQLK